MGERVEPGSYGYLGSQPWSPARSRRWVEAWVGKAWARELLGGETEGKMGMGLGMSKHSWSTQPHQPEQEEPEFSRSLLAVTSDS